MSRNDIHFQRVLLVEDDPSHALIIKRALRGIVGEIMHALSLADALKLMDSDTPEIIITDLHLPDAPDEGPLSRLQARAAGVPIVVLTASTSLQDAVEAMKQGAEDFVVKEFDANFREVLSFSLARVAQSLAAERERQRLQREMDLLRVSIENNQDSLALVDETGIIVYANRSFGAFAKRCAGGGEKLQMLFSDGVVANVSKLKENVARNLSSLAAGGVFTTEVTFSADKTLAYEFSLSALPVAGSKMFAVWVRDRSPQKQREKFQREILSTTTHDLKGPLGAIIISAELLTNALSGKGKEKELALRIGSSAQGAVNLIDEFLSARRIQEGTFILRPAAHDIVALVDSAVADFETISAARGVQLDVQRPSMHVEGAVDKLGFVRVVSNLMSNAIKFTPKGGKVSIEVSEVGDNVHVTVRDTGCGMEPSEVNTLFERFARLEKHREVAGSGLGLFVVRSIVAAHGGKIDVTSMVGQGTSFDVVFPKAPPVNERGELISLSFA